MTCRRSATSIRSGTMTESMISIVTTLDERCAERVQTRTEEPLCDERILLHEAPRLVLRIGAEDDDRRADTVLTSPGEDHPTVLGCRQESLVVSGGDGLVRLGPCIGIRGELGTWPGRELVDELGDHVRRIRSFGTLDLMDQVVVSGLASGTASLGKSEVAVAEVLEGLDIGTDATHCSVISSDGTYTASIPLDALRSGGVLVLVSPEEGGPIRLRVMDGSTLCWNVKDVGELHLTAGTRPDSIPANPTH
jgi:hypothetical protein